MLDPIKHAGVIGDSIPPNLALPMVASRDIAHVAVPALRARNWKGVVVRKLLGPIDLTYAEAHTHCRPKLLTPSALPHFPL